MRVVAGSGSPILLVLIGLVSYGAVRARDPVDRLQDFARELGARRYGARLPSHGPPKRRSWRHLQRHRRQPGGGEGGLRRSASATWPSLTPSSPRRRSNSRSSTTNCATCASTTSLAEMNGLVATALVGKRVRNPDAVAALEHVLATESRCSTSRSPSKGRVRRPATSRSAPAATPRSRSGQRCSDIEARRRAEDARERLQHATATLAATVTVADVAATAVAEARATFDSDGAALLLARATGSS